MAPLDKKPRTDAAASVANHPLFSAAAGAQVPAPIAGAQAPASIAATPGPSANHPSASAAAGAQAPKPIAGAEAPAPIAATPGPMPMVELLTTGFSKAHGKDYLSLWAGETKAYVDDKLVKFLKARSSQVSFPVPSQVLLFPALEIKTAASGAKLTSFREVMNHENLMLSFSQSSQYEGAGTVFMCDFVTETDLDIIRPSQLESASSIWSEEAFNLSSHHALTRRFSFDVPLPVKVVDPKVVQKKEKNSSAVVMAHALPVLAGRALLMTWYGAMAEALQKNNEEVVFRLFEAALSVPLRLRLCPDGESCFLAGLMFSEALFASSAAAGAVSFWVFAGKARRLPDLACELKGNSSLAKIKAAIKQYGLTFKSKAVSDAQVKALKAMEPFLGDDKCNEAYNLSESICPEIMDPTLIMRIAQLSSARPASIPAEHFSFILGCLRVMRLTGNFQEGQYTVSNVTGQEKNQPAMVHTLFKKQDITEFIMHELSLMSQVSVAEVEFFRTPLTIVSRFSASGETGLMTSYRAGDVSASEGFESMFALRVAEYRDAEGIDGKAAAAIDFLWTLWCGPFDEEIKEIIAEELQSNGAVGFLWHRYLSESTKEMGLKYRAFVEACAAGPIVPAAGGQQSIVGASELGEEDQAELRKVQDMLMMLRRKSVSFEFLPSIGGASGPEYSKMQLEKLWEGLRLGYKFQRKKTDCRAFVLSAELFPPNVAKQALLTSMSEQLRVEKERFARTIEFIVARRCKEDVVILCDGRGRESRKVIESFEDKLTASGANAYVESWIVYTQGRKGEDPRVPQKQTLFANNYQEVVVCSLAATKSRTASLIQRSEFNSCGEMSTASKTYTGVDMRLYRELPRMDAETKAACVGMAASGAVPNKRVQKDIDAHGHPYSHAEVKPLALWQRIVEHNGVTHIVDFAAGSGALAISVAGTIEYQGIAANEAHCKWLDSTLDRCIMYLAGKEKEFAKRLGGDDAFMMKVEKYFGGMVMDARRLLEPSERKDGSDDDGSDDDENSDATDKES